MPEKEIYNTEEKKEKSRNPYYSMRGIASGLTGWMTFQAFCLRRGAYSEHYLYGPVVEIALAQGWEVLTQYPIEYTEGPGAPKTIDFVLEKGEKLLGIEVKWVKIDKQQVNLTKDIEKLNKLESDNPSKEVHKFLMICGVSNRVRLVEEKEEKLASYSPEDVKDQIKNADKTSFTSGGSWFSEYKTYRTNYSTVVIEIKPNSPQQKPVHGSSVI